MDQSTGSGGSSAVLSDTPSIAPSTEDIVWEVGNIAKVIGRSERQTYHLLSTGQLPAKQVGKRWVASRSKLIAFLLEGAA